MPEFDVVELPETDHIETGNEAPDFTRPLVNAEFWEDESLSNIIDEGPVLLVTYPMDGAFQATYIWNEIRDRAWTDDVQVVGLSISSPYEHKTLLAERDVDARLFSDPRADVIAEYGVTHDIGGMTGITEARPAIFLIDADREVRYAWIAGKHPEFPDYEAVEAAIADL